jgi:hypothetical protein
VASDGASFVSDHDKRQKGEQMDAMFAAIAIAFVLMVLMVVASALFEISPFTHHKDQYHRPGERQNSPRLD